MDDFKDPAASNILDEQGEFGESQRQQVVQLIDEPRPLADDGLESAGDLAERAQGLGQELDRRRLRADGVARGSAGLDGIGLLAAEDGGAIVFVALRIAARDTPRHLRARRASAGRGARAGKRVQKVQQVVGILAGGVEADDKVDAAVAVHDLFEPLAELGVACCRLGELQLGRGRL